MLQLWAVEIEGNKILDGCLNEHSWILGQSCILKDKIEDWRNLL